jgi:two-component system sensor histidine kinase/response regulator
MTAYALTGDRDKFLEAGMNDYLSKPLKAGALQQSLERWQSPTIPEDDRQQPTTSPDPVPDAAVPPVDLAQLREVTGHNQHEMRELVNLYLEQTATEMAKLQVAISAGAMRDVERLAHGCAGASSNCGMVGIAPLFKELEHAAREGQLTNGAERCAVLVEAFERTKSFLQSLTTLGIGTDA